MNAADLLEGWDEPVKKPMVRKYRPDIPVPVFQTAGLGALFHFGSDIDRKLLAEFLRGDKQALRADLCLIIAHVVEYSEEYESHFERRAKAEDREFINAYQSEYFFFTHAVFLRAELGADGLMDDLLPVLEMDADSAEFWIKGRLEDAFWMVFQKILGLPKGMVLARHALCNPGFNPQSRRAIATAMSFHTFLYPFERASFERELTAAVGHFLENLDDPFAPRFFESAIWDTVHHRLEASLPGLRRLFALGLMQKGSYTSIEDVEFASEEQKDPWIQDSPKPILELYEFWERTDRLTKGTFSVQKALLDAAKPKLSRGSKPAAKKILPATAKQQPHIAKKAAGRNAPCPCGSGLKYKKCHGK